MIEESAKGGAQASPASRKIGDLYNSYMDLSLIHICCAVCESEEITASLIEMPNELGKWKFLLADKVIYCCSNGHRFLMLPDESRRSEALL